MAIELVVRERDGERRPTRAFSKRQESSVAEATGGRRNPNSGATDFGGKADVNICNLISVECKTKTSPSKSMSIPCLAVRMAWLSCSRET